MSSLLVPAHDLTDNQPALIPTVAGAALRSGHIAAAALDVHWNEPWKRDVGALKEAPNLFCCPHQAWYSPESRAEMRRKGAEAARRALFADVQSSGTLRDLLRNTVNAALLDELEVSKRFAAELARQQES